MCLGEEANLIGMFTEPVTPEPGRPTVVMLNAGVLHRVGPHRLHVRLARALAARGLASLRFDLSGIGDSRAVPGGRSFWENAVFDTRAAMDGLASASGASRFVLFGLCSGADNALATAAKDPRVTGLVLLDPPSYATRRSRARKLVARARELHGPRQALTWGVNVVTRVARRELAALERRLGAEDAVADDEGGRETPAPEVYRARLHSLLDRHVAILAVYSGSLDERYNHEDQLFELFPELRGRMDRKYFAQANHMFTALSAQAELVETVSDWIARR